MFPVLLAFLACSRPALPPIEGNTEQQAPLDNVPDAPLAPVPEAPGEPAVAGPEADPFAEAEGNAPGSAAIAAARARHLARTFRAQVDALAVPPSGRLDDHRAEVRALRALANVVSALYGDTHVGRGAAWDVLRYAQRLDADGVSEQERSELVEAALRSSLAAMRPRTTDAPELRNLVAEAEFATEAIRGDRSAASQRRAIGKAFRALSDVVLFDAEARGTLAPQQPARPTDEPVG